MWVAFSAKNIRILYIESTEIVNEMTLNELVKLTTLWTTGPRFVFSEGRCVRVVVLYYTIDMSIVVLLGQRLSDKIGVSMMIIDDIFQLDR